MRHVLDAGALIAIDRADRDVMRRLALAHRRGQDVVTHGGVVGQVWRDGSRQARLARALAGIRVAPVDQSLGRRIGHLLAATGGRDVVDAGVAALVADGDEVVTSDPGDLTDLVAATGAHAEIHLV